MVVDRDLSKAHGVSRLVSLFVFSCLRFSHLSLSDFVLLYNSCDTNLHSAALLSRGIDQSDSRCNVFSCETLTSYRAWSRYDEITCWLLFLYFLAFSCSTPFTESTRNTRAESSSVSARISISRTQHVRHFQDILAAALTGNFSGDGQHSPRNKMFLTLSLADLFSGRIATRT